ncbi:GntR family transcriptional regulator [Oceanobacillus neutriphilus]|uniref:GntR family transcriptional regulator n=1 Tax=Oceanobacillus neutriphilus TaxID=531815 RepID=A0ABQ2NTG5_9BACI|nr:GntR family transcriptional regulator [Oceanobacillus neutriphilus]GGP09998.1 GntR family transcriptional regulator [Oceanobacillus neutriphilus]
MKAFYPKKKLMNESKGEQVVAELRMRIISREIKAGTVLSENQLGSLFQVSRSPVREALRVLANENLVRPERMGAVVVGMSEKSIEEIYDIRLMIESFTFERLLKMQTDTLVQELKKMVEMMKIAIKYQDVDQFSFLDIEFHETIIQSIDHHHIKMLWNNLKPVLECLIILSMRYRMMTNEKDFERILYNHELIVEAIDKKEKEMVDLAFERNFHDVQNQVEDLWIEEEIMKTVREYSVKE